MSDSTTTTPAAAAPAASTTTTTSSERASNVPNVKLGTPTPRVDVKPTLRNDLPNKKTDAAPKDPTKPEGAKSIPTDDPADTVEAKPQTETPTEAAERKARKLKLKVDGAEIDYDIDATSDEDLATELQLAKAARKRMQEAADIRKKFTELVQRGQQDPFKAMEELFGVDGYKIAEEKLRQKYLEEELPPHEQEK